MRRNQTTPFSVWLNEGMKRRRMTQRQLAYFAGIDHSAVSRLSRGQNGPTLETAMRLRAILRADCVCSVPPVVEVGRSVA